MGVLGFCCCWDWLELLDEELLLLLELELEEELLWLLLCCWFCWFCWFC